MTPLILLQPHEQALRLSRLRSAAAGLPDGSAMVFADNAMLYYLTGRVFSGWGYIPVDGSIPPVWFVKRPVEMSGENVFEVRKPEEIPARLAEAGYQLPTDVALELDALSFSTVTRLRAIFPQGELHNASRIASAARSVKTPLEISMIERSGTIQSAVYARIPGLFEPGMTDYELDVAIETLSRREGCLGQFRIAGTSMEFFMGNILTGENADAPSPYDFALGGAGADPSLPVGATGEMIRRGSAVSVDVNGNYTGYMSDMTRVFSYGELPKMAVDAHRCSIDIHNRFREMARPGCKAADIYMMALETSREAGFEKYFMGHRQHASFCGHGVGIEINEMPVIAPRSRDILVEGNVIAFEPKFVIPHVGAVGNESTYAVTPDGGRCLTNAPEEILPLEH